MTSEHKTDRPKCRAQFPFSLATAYFEGLRAAMLYWTGLHQSNLDLVVPYLKATEFFWETERDKLAEMAPEDNLKDYSRLVSEDLLMLQAVFMSAHKQITEYHVREMKAFLNAWLATMLGARDGTLEDYALKLAKTLDALVVGLPQAVEEIGKEYGFHFDNGLYPKVGETDRMVLYQVLPNEPGVEVRNDIKPILMVHPYVLGPNIIAFLPGERRSYVHSFANMGIPTYARIVKDIAVTPAVQVMTAEDDVRDTRTFAELLFGKHGKPVTLNGICQGGYIATLSLLTGELDGLVDALITCATPLDGTLSKGLREYLQSVLPRFRTLAYSTKTLPNGNRVIDGTVMGWVYKLKSLKYELPLDYYRRLEAFEAQVQKGRNPVDKVTAAILRWLTVDRTDIPIEITKLSTASYGIPITCDGIMPVTLFGRRLNLSALRLKGIRVQICYGAQDMLVDPPSSLIALRFVNAEVAEFPKGHAAIFTSWASPDSQYALHKEFGQGQKGPVRFHLDLDAELAAKASGTARSRSATDEALTESLDHVSCLVCPSCETAAGGNLPE